MTPAGDAHHHEGWSFVSSGSVRALWIGQPPVVVARERDVTMRPDLVFTSYVVT